MTKYTTKNGETWMISFTELNGYAEVVNNGYLYEPDFTDEDIEELIEWIEYVSERGEEFKSTLYRVAA